MSSSGVLGVRGGGLWKSPGEFFGSLLYYFGLAWGHVVRGRTTIWLFLFELIISSTENSALVRLTARLAFNLSTPPAAPNSSRAASPKQGRQDVANKINIRTAPYRARFEPIDLPTFT